ncbi:unnamed protein product [Vitrella brassicaformis CCMP3155]|uniref:Uncharacterized protein n=1 Tax=Vitrella brassicaformis (strain CCMP3155) TaxID=1169540 RepID=A0A0G4G0T6_VITBC|nr:unnamed protein product [Vitrella brassicaformis CCMP3155]|eukprot:CEM21242.1 unnamed protein product [Vitrella brassicaformis CCMP3155]
MQHLEQQQHPVSYLCVGRRSRYLLSVKDVVPLRATCTWQRELFGAAQLRDRLSHSLGSQAGLRRAVNGEQLQLLRFDDDQFVTHDLLAAVCVVEEGDWGEMVEVIGLAGQCGNFELPVILTADDINTHANIKAYVSAPRVLAQLEMVGRHIHFSDGTCLQLFHHGNQWRAIIDEPNFRLDVDPPLPAGHLYRRHRQPQDPPVRSPITQYSAADARWLSSAFNERIDASLSSFAKCKILDHFYGTHRQQINDTFTRLTRDVVGARLDGLFIQSPHTSVPGCTTTVSRDDCVRRLVLTDGSHPFVAWVDIVNLGKTGKTVTFLFKTTEAAVCGSSLLSTASR